MLSLGLKHDRKMQACNVIELVRLGREHSHMQTVMIKNGLDVIWNSDKSL